MTTSKPGAGGGMPGPIYRDKVVFSISDSELDHLIKKLS